jgi:hypothetical protein
MEWQIYLRDRCNEFNPDYWYLAQIACEVRRGHVKAPNRLKVKDFILKFNDSSSNTITTEQATQWAKQRMFGMLKLDSNGNQIKAK